MPDQTTDHLSEAVEAFREEVHHGPGALLLNAAMVRRGLRAAEPFFATYYEDKVKAELRDGLEERIAPWLLEDIQTAAEEKGRSEERERLRSESARLAAFEALTTGDLFTFTDPEGQEEYVWRYVDAVLDASLGSDQESQNA